MVGASGGIRQSLFHNKGSQAFFFARLFPNRQRVPTSKDQIAGTTSRAPAQTRSNNSSVASPAYE